MAARASTELEATAQAVAAAHGAQVQSAIESVDWERRGPLGRLVRNPGPAQIGRRRAADLAAGYGVRRPSTAS
jgi:hypothetical protein